MDIGTLAHNIKNCRNGINHFGFQKDTTRDNSTLARTLNKSYKELLEVIERQG